MLEFSKRLGLCLGIAAAFCLGACGDDDSSSDKGKTNSGGDASTAECTSNDDCKDVEGKPVCDQDKKECVAEAEQGGEGEGQGGEGQGGEGQGGEGCEPACGVGFKCENNACVKGDACSGVNCDEGKKCLDVGGIGTCVENACIENNAPKACDAGKICKGGECVDDSCNPACQTSESCSNGVCIETACIGKVCDPGYSCKGGDCIENACLDKKCDGQICIGGECLYEACKTVNCPQGKICQSDGSCAFEDAPEILVKVTNDDKTTSEDGKTVSLQVSLSQEPAKDVTLAIVISDTNEAEVVCADSTNCGLTFTPANYKTPQAVEIRGINDNVADEDKPYSVSLTSSSEDTEFNGLSIKIDGFTNKDAGAQAISVIVSYPEGSMTSESGRTVPIKVSLSAQPTKDVTFTVSSDKPTEGTVDVSSITFTPSNWNVEQTITVTGVPDNQIDAAGNNVYHIVFGNTVSEDENFNGLTIPSIELINIDTNKAGIFLSADSNLTIDESELTATVGIALSQAPTDEVKCKAESGDITEAIIENDEIVFNKNNWETDQFFIIKGVQDGEIDGNQPFTINFSCKSERQEAFNISGVIISGTCVDTTQPGLTAIAAATSIKEPKEDEPDADKTEISVTLSAKPTKDVTVNIAVSDENELAIDKSSLTFSAPNWNTAQTITVSSLTDNIVDGPKTVRINFTTASDDTNFNALTIDPLVITVEDVDVAAILVEGEAQTLEERGMQSAEFKVSLSAKPSKNVTVKLESMDASELELVDDSNLVFTTDNWNEKQSVRVRAKNDGAADGNQVAKIMLTSTSSDKLFKNLTAYSPEYTIVDADMATLVVSASKTSITNAVNDAAVRIKLSSRPSSDVVVFVSSKKPSLISPSRSSITFTPDNYNTEQVITFELKKFEQLYEDVTVTMTTASESTVYSGLSESIKLHLTAFESQDFNYTGAVQQVELYPGEYVFETWGASGGSNYHNGVIYENKTGLGGYNSGTIEIKEATTFYIYVGGRGVSGSTTRQDSAGGWNGGGTGSWDHSDDEVAGGGGGATDIRLVKGNNWDDFDSLKSRIMVAGGGGGLMEMNPTDSRYNNRKAGYAGGLVGNSSTDNYGGGTQTSGFAFGKGRSSTMGTTCSDGIGGGGGGYYGGETQTITSGCPVSSNGKAANSGAGGSSFISGHEGCDAIAETSTESAIVHTGQPDHYSNLVFTDTIMKAGNEVMPAPSGGENTEIGHEGNGFARIKRVAD